MSEAEIKKPVRVILVEDDLLQLDVLKLTLASDDDIEVVGAYSDPRKAYEDLDRSKPELLLTDIGLPGMTGIELIEMVKKKLPEIEIIALTVFEDIKTVFEAIKAGANGYLLKSSSAKDLLKAIKDIRAGGAPITPKIARAMLKDFQSKDDGGDTALSNREREILQEVEKGLGYKEVAETVNLSVHTVHWHIKNIFAKLHAKNKRDAISKAREKGIL
ncbi:MAG: response regulator transcription factor [Nitrospinae bacterium]|nr:response regulator transcription factor [Nitrospinota bacterium]